MNVNIINPDTSNPNILRRLFGAAAVGVLGTLALSACGDEYFGIDQKEIAILKAMDAGENSVVFPDDAKTEADIHYLEGTVTVEGPARETPVIDDDQDPNNSNVYGGLKLDGTEIISLTDPVIVTPNKNDPANIWAGIKLPKEGSPPEDEEIWFKLNSETVAAITENLVDTPQGKSSVAVTK